MLALFAGTALFSPSTAAWAQEQAPARQPAISTDDSNDIIVTARRREESIQNVPVAITAFGKSFLQDHAVDSIGDLVTFTPGFTVSEASGGAGGIIYLRGIGSTAAHPLIDQAVASNLDGVQISSGLILRATEFDVQQVEVLRGPQALFFGKNSPGGVISFRTADPGDHFEGMLRAGYEFNAREYTAEGVLSGPIGEGWGARLAAAYGKMDGWLKIRSVNAVTTFGTAIVPDSDRVPDSEQVFLRGTLTYNNGGPFSARAKLTYLHSMNNVGNGFYQQRVYCPLGVPQIRPGVASPPEIAIDDCRADGTVVGGNIPPSLFTVNPRIRNDASGFRRNTQWLGSLELNYDVNDNLKLTSVSGYYNVHEPQNSQYTFAPIAESVFSVNVTDIEQISQEVRLASSFDGPVNFLMGGIYDHTRKRAYGSTILGTTVIGPEDYIQKANDWSVFAQITYKIIPQVELSAGGRYSHDKKTVDVILRGTRLANLVQDEISVSDFSPEVTLSYEPNSNLLLYGSYRQAFKAGGFDGGQGTASRLAANPTQRFSYDPEHAEGGEIGARGSFDGGRGRISLTGYKYDYKGLQYSAYDPITGGLRITNAANATIKGVEMDATWRPSTINGLTLRATGAYNHTRFNEFIAGCYGGQTIANGCNLNLNAAGAFTSQDLSGRPLSYAPRFSGSAGFSYEQDVGNYLLGFSADAYHASKAWTSLEQSPGSLQKSYTTIDASVRVSGQDKNWELALIGKNLSNQYILGRSNTVSLTGTNTGRAGPGVPGDIAATVSRGRQILAQFTWRFGS